MVDNVHSYPKLGDHQSTLLQRQHFGKRLFQQAAGRPLLPRSVAGRPASCKAAGTWARGHLGRGAASSARGQNPPVTPLLPLCRRPRHPRFCAPATPTPPARQLAPRAGHTPKPRAGPPYLRFVCVRCRGLQECAPGSLPRAARPAPGHRSSSGRLRGATPARRGGSPGRSPQLLKEVPGGTP